MSAANITKLNQSESIPGRSEVDEELVEAFVQILNSPCDFDDRPRVMERMREHPREAEVALTRIERTIQVLRQQIRAGL